MPHRRRDGRSDRWIVDDSLVQHGESPDLIFIVKASSFYIDNGEGNFIEAYFVDGWHRIGLSYMGRRAKEEGGEEQDWGKEGSWQHGD